MWTNIKTWAIAKWPLLKAWLLKNWMYLVNFLVLAILYAKLPEDSGLGVLVGLWIFTIIGVLGWRAFQKAK
jgi:hypothetical protein